MISFAIRLEAAASRLETMATRNNEHEKEERSSGLMDAPALSQQGSSGPSLKLKTRCGQDLFRNTL